MKTLVAQAKPRTDSRATTMVLATLLGALSGCGGAEIEDSEVLFDTVTVQILNGIRAPVFVDMHMATTGARSDVRTVAAGEDTGVWIAQLDGTYGEYNYDLRADITIHDGIEATKVTNDFFYRPTQGLSRLIVCPVLVDGKASRSPDHGEAFHAGPNEASFNVVNCTLDSPTLDISLAPVGSGNTATHVAERSRNSDRGGDNVLLVKGTYSVFVNGRELRTIEVPGGQKTTLIITDHRGTGRFNGTVWNAEVSR